MARTQSGSRQGRPKASCRRCPGCCRSRKVSESTSPSRRAGRSATRRKVSWACCAKYSAGKGSPPPSAGTSTSSRGGGNSVRRPDTSATTPLHRQHSSSISSQAAESGAETNRRRGPPGKYAPAV